MSDIVTRLRNYDTCHDGDIDEAADMLDFFFGQMQMQSPKMNGQHSYLFKSTGWPMTHCKGPNAVEAVQAAISEIKRSKAELGASWDADEASETRGEE
jgi:neutral trehalase